MSREVDDDDAKSLDEDDDYYAYDDDDVDDDKDDDDNDDEHKSRPESRSYNDEPDHYGEAEDEDSLLEPQYYYQPTYPKIKKKKKHKKKNRKKTKVYLPVFVQEKDKKKSKLTIRSIIIESLILSFYQNHSKGVNNINNKADAPTLVVALTKKRKSQQTIKIKLQNSA